MKKIGSVSLESPEREVRDGLRWKRQAGPDAQTLEDRRSLKFILTAMGSDRKS